MTAGQLDCYPALPGGYIFQVGAGEGRAPGFSSAVPTVTAEQPWSKVQSPKLFQGCCTLLTAASDEIPVRARLEINNF